MSESEVAAAELNSLEKIKEKFYAGKASLDESQKNELFESLQKRIAAFYENDSIDKNSASIKSLNDIFNSSLTTHLVYDMMNYLNDEIFYNLGIFIAKQFDSAKQEIKEDLINLIHSYLDVFRFPQFLTKIYEQERWEDLILNLIRTGNYNFSELFNRRTEQYKDKTLFKVLHGSKEVDYGWEKVKQLTGVYGKSFLNVLNNTESKEEKIAFLMENSICMAVLDLTCLTNGIVNIMIPANSVPQHISFILNQTKAPVVMISDEKQLAKIRSVKKELQYLEKVIIRHGNGNESWVISFKEFESGSKNISDETLQARRSTIDIDSLSTIMYTSGTTGEPKGIMFSQMNIVYKRFCRAIAIPEIGDRDVYLAFLPLFHTFGRWLEMAGSVFWGATYAFMENPAVDTMISEMRQVKPTIFISVPKKWNQIFEYVTSQVDIELDDEELIRDKIKEATGGRLRWGLSAAGFLSPDVFRFFQKYGIELMSGFGMTEATGGITMTPPGRYKYNSLGKALPGIKIKLDEDGEIKIKGGYVMMGYFAQPREEVFDEDGWFGTGDIMKMDEDNFIEIIDRKKEIYKNTKGETIAPQRIENFFKDFESVKQVFLVGDHRPFNTVLIYPDYETENPSLKEFSSEQLQEYFASVIVTVNKFLSPFERIVDFKVIDRPFQESHGELTPKGTYKRRVIEKNFAHTINLMYEKDHTAVIVDNMEVRIPNWFLREKGSLYGDIMALPDSISLPKQQINLKIERHKKFEKVYRIGNYYYAIDTPYIELQQILINPVYWLGNEELLEFTGSAVFQWYRYYRAHHNIRFYSKTKERIFDTGKKEELKKLISSGDKSLNGLHLATCILQSAMIDEGVIAVQYIQNILDDEENPLYQYAFELILRPNLTSSLPVKREMLKTSIIKTPDFNLEKVLEIYLHNETHVLDDGVIRTIVGAGKGGKNLESIRNILKNQLSKLSDDSEVRKSAVPHILKLLTHYGINHPASYERIRQIFVRNQLKKDWKNLVHLSHEVRTRLREGFRDWLGDNQIVSVDMETGEEYSWEDVITFDEEIDEKDKNRLFKAIKGTPVLREAIFLFSNGTLVRLNDIPIGGIWVSFYAEYDSKKIYRISVQTRLQGSFEIILNLNNNPNQEEVNDEINWLILAGSRYFVQELVEDFGGYWEEYDLWSQKFIPGDNVEKIIQRELKRKDSNEERLYHLWPFLVWNASAAYMNFWKLTNYKLQLTNPSTKTIIIPSHDYQTGTRFVSLSSRSPFESLTGLLSNFYIKFVKTAEDKYPFLKRDNIWNYIFSGIMNAEGEEDGLKILEQIPGELKSDNVFEEKELILKQLVEYMKNVEENGFTPKQLFFAVKRFHRWFLLNKEAAHEAQAQMLKELYDTYNLEELEKSHPATRTQFFLKTAFADSTPELRKVLLDIAKRQHSQKISKDESLQLLSQIHSEFDLTEKEEFFLTRLSYPHLKPSDSAALMKMKTEGEDTANLVVQLEDIDGNPYYIRKPITPKEISRLHQIYIEANLQVHFRDEHHFLVAISSRGFIIGGLFYTKPDERTAYMEKIVVSSRYRRKGISEGLMNEFFSRLKDEHISYVTTGFFRPEYFYRFGFKIERKYSGLAKELTS